MARVAEFKELKKERNSLHEIVDCTYTVFVSDAGKRILQIDSYGTKHRKLSGKVSQTLQFDEQTARRLERLIAHTFG